MFHPVRLPLLPVVCLLMRAQGVDVLTQHNDAARTGANLRETILTKSNVRTQTFGKLFDIPVEGQVYAQPLIVSGLTIGRPFSSGSNLVFRIRKLPGRWRSRR